MVGKESITDDHAASAVDSTPQQAPIEADALGSLMRQRSARLDRTSLPEVVIGELIAIAEDGRTPMLIYPGQPGTAALRARTVVDLHGEHIGKAVVISFENGDASLPIVMGVLRSVESQSLDAPRHVQVDADGERMVVSAKEQLVLRCGKASITLTKAGKVIIEGSYVVSRSSGVNRVKGGSVQLN
jgi:hypothetical protein